jgi:cephalosporin hydroxylase
MDPKLCRDINLMTMELIANYFEQPVSLVQALYQELLDDHQFMAELNQQITFCRQFHQRGIFKHEKLDNVDWFGVQRILLYVLIRLKQPEVFVETGVFYGGNTAFILNALRRNKKGHLFSFDLAANDIRDLNRHHLVGDSEIIPEGLDVGFIVHDNLKTRWSLIRGHSHEQLPLFDLPIDIFMHDSDHAHNFVLKEFEIVWSKLTADAVILADDLDWSNAFFQVCIEQKLLPLIITDNGKSGLLARTGLARLDHPARGKPDVVGN